MPNNRRQTWYDGIPQSRNKWEHFSADKLEGNEIQNGDQTLAKIPKIPGMISRRTKKDGNFVTTYIELILSHTYDKDKKQSRNRRVIIGTDISHIFPGMMVINDKYHDYFDTKGNLIAKTREDNPKDKNPKDNDPKGERQTEKAEPMEQPNEQPEDQPQPQTQQQPQSQPNPQTEPREEDEDDWDEDDEDPEEDDEIRQMLQKSQYRRDRTEYLNSLLIEYKTTIDEQAKRRPDKPLTLYQIRRINELLAEVMDILSDYDTGTFLRLAEEPTEDNTDTKNNTNKQPITYADMAILLSAFYCTMFSYRTHQLWRKSWTEE